LTRTAWPHRRRAIKIIIFKRIFQDSPSNSARTRLDSVCGVSTGWVFAAILLPSLGLVSDHQTAIPLLHGEICIHNTYIEGETTWRGEREKERERLWLSGRAKRRERKTVFPSVLGRISAEWILSHIIMSHTRTHISNVCSLTGNFALRDWIYRNYNKYIYIYIYGLRPGFMTREILRSPTPVLLTRLYHIIIIIITIVIVITVSVRVVGFCTLLGCRVL